MNDQAIHEYWGHVIKYIINQACAYIYVMYIKYSHFYYLPCIYITKGLYERKSHSFQDKMASHIFHVVHLALLAVLVSSVHGFPSGAPATACESMIPGHRGQSPQTSAPPFAVRLGKTTYSPNEQITGIGHFYIRVTDAEYYCWIGNYDIYEAFIGNGLSDKIVMCLS